MSDSGIYQHQWFDGTDISLPVGKVVCIGRNYAEHAKELNNPIPSEPLLFMKPATSLVALSNELTLPKAFGEVHYEAEISVLIGEKVKNVTDLNVAEAALAGIGTALDLTLRDLQSTLKSKGQPWEKAKAFDGACPVSTFVPRERLGALDQLDIRLDLDQVTVQAGNSSDMLTGVLELICYCSQFFTLMPGDVVLTGTPKGVGVLRPDQDITLTLANQFGWSARTC